MIKNTYTEEEFKKMVKTLLTDKKREEESEPEIDVLRKQLEKVKPALKKLNDELKETREEIEKIRAEEHLKYNEKESEIALLNERLELQKKEYEAHLKEAKEQSEVPFYQKEVLRLEESLEEERRKALLREDEFKSLSIRLLEKEKEEHRVIQFEEERSRLVERLAVSVSQSQRQADQIRDLRQETGELLEGKKGLEAELERQKARLAQLQMEHTGLERISEKRNLEQQEEEERLKAACATFSKELERRELEVENLKNKLLQAEVAYKSSDTAQLKKEYEEKLALITHEAKIREVALLAEKEKALEEMKVTHLAEEMFQRQEKEKAQEELARLREDSARALQEKEKLHEEILAGSYGKLKELFQKNTVLIEENHSLKETAMQKHEQVGKREQEIESLETLLQNAKSKAQEKELEIRKAQGHLAKKVKENAMLCDVLEKQKNQLVEQQTLLVSQKNEIEKMKSTLHLQRLHEEKIEAMAKERAQAAETLSKEWQDKYLALHLEWQEAKGQLAELLKMKKHHEQLSATFTSMKTLLGKAFEPREENQTKKIPTGYDEDFFET